MLERGLLAGLVTNGFNYATPRGLAALLNRFSSFKARIAGRTCRDIPDALVDGYLLPDLVVQVAGRLSPRLADKVFAQQEKYLAARAVKAARGKNVRALLSYSYCAYHAFKALQGSGVRLLLFQCHPHPAMVKSILQEEMRVVPGWARTLAAEKELSWGPGYVAQLEAEAALADHVFAASTFTKKSLLAAGVPENKISVVPYGADSRLCRLSARLETREKQRILFVGQMGQRKGLSYLLEACAQMDMTNRELRLCGRGFDLPDAISKNPPAWLCVRRNLSEQDLAEEYRNADVFVLPSIIEGFGLVILEALSFGLPVVATRNTGAPDIMNDGIEGRLVDVRDVSALKGAIELILSQEQLRTAMSAAALAAAGRNDWSRFRRTLADRVQEML
jgi:glycosyltransferase involved in cell wall biosynthesis